MVLIIVLAVCLGSSLAINGYLWGRFIENRMRADKSETQATTATERLYASWKEGATIPPPPDEKPEPPEPIPSELRPFIEQWESPEGRLKAEYEIRALLSSGLTVPAIMRRYEEPKL